MKQGISALSLLFLITHLSACLRSNYESEHAESVDCAGIGKWEYGSKGIGPEQEYQHPFIEGQIPGYCSQASSQLIRAIKQALNRNVPDSTNKIAIFTMGAPGSGKSTSLAHLLKILHLASSDLVAINIDELRSRLPDYIAKTTIPSVACPGKFRAFAQAPLWCMQSAANIRINIWNDVMQGEKSFIYDSTCGSSGNCAKLMHEAQARGFKVYLLAVYASEQECLNRAHNRALLTGIYLPEWVIIDSYKNIKGNFGNLANLAIESGGKAFIYDNRGERPILDFTMNNIDELCDKKIYESCRYFLK